MMRRKFLANLYFIATSRNTKNGLLSNLAFSILIESDLCFLPRGLGLFVTLDMKWKYDEYGKDYA